ncbi:hypothetical protein [Billgrantia kenyensis]|uniref:Pre-peptidase C-terminal domain-containing protein n=1 Tax=Billgrantia kenyensis TaxID=321266 RepID=A0A7V9W297_9GAMM|nr:hypothetical protein [Halomonas kenyensis]MBA2779737.1 hypothetical protein [Halomonas kenyensis]MCG6662578.1 hypothetical protein [Halomonas kenyensis]
MRRYAAVLFSILLLLTGCAGTSDPRDHAIPLTPDRPFEVMSTGMRHFTFSLQEPARVVLESETFPWDSAMAAPSGELLDADGEVVARDWHSGIDGNFRIERELEAGVWYLRVTTPHAGSSVGLLDRDYRYTVILRVAEE